MKYSLKLYELKKIAESLRDLEKRKDFNEEILVRYIANITKISVKSVKAIFRNARKLYPEIVFNKV